ncbi:hypothetical protein [Scleromatobacter humisilvae]|uniref:Uncharacterized protein n=1 Tax=Scleromatobacter humisilvae TaxID=2897159 RepID=A0A9X1YES7_9BURK|nr:hypothetical protein [Scleromatobacter humisilvae]MCK9684267.1 hypothetical protein [Scleromatobacter humisilvae]
MKTQLGDSMQAFARTGLLGVTEANRGRYDYACSLERDFVRAMDAQVCWGNSAGLAKDIHHLLVASEAPIRLLVLRNTVAAHRQLEESLADHGKRDPSRLTGFRYFALPVGFDADKEDLRDWMADHLRQRLCADLLFGTIFGRLAARDLRAFVNHGGPFGLKCAVLGLCARHPIYAMGSLMTQLGTKSNSSVREVLVMLTSAGFLYQMPHQQPWLPTLKGRFLLDLLTRLLFESETRSEWSPEIRLILNHLNIPSDKLRRAAEIQELLASRQLDPRDSLVDLLCSAIWSGIYFDVDLRKGIDADHPVFRSELDWSKFENLVPGSPLPAAQLMELD